jgi:arylsulfatase A
LPAEQASRATGRQPNIVLIVADDLGSTDLGCYGAGDLRTPHLDALAARGVRFTDFDVTAPACTPSRASLLTGREHARVLRRNVGLEAGETTLAELLRGAGYRTGLFGKWHLGIPPANSPTAQGFDEFTGFKVGAIDNWSHTYYWGAGKTARLWRDDEPYREDGTYFPDITTREALGFIERHRDKPFFLYLPSNQPHYPLQAPVDHEKAVGHIADPARRAYAACVHVLDDMVGQVVAALDRHGLTENTILLFLSDHGHSDEEDALGGGSSGPYRGHKGSLLEGGIRVPCVASWPGHWPAGVVRRQLLSSTDWLPTLAAAGGAPLPDVPLDGHRLDDVIASPDHRVRDTLCWAWVNDWAVRDDRWKLVGTGPSQMAMFDLVNDPGETTDRRAAEYDAFHRLAVARNDWARRLLQDPTVARELGQ